MRYIRFFWVKLVTTIANLLGHYEKTMLHKAVINNDYEKVKSLIDSGANVKFARKEYDWYYPYVGTILNDALENADDIRIAELLFSHGAQLIEPNRQLTDFICYQKYYPVKFLLEHGATLPQHNIDGNYVQIDVPAEKVDQRIAELLQSKLHFYGSYEFCESN